MVTENDVILAIDSVRSMLGELKSMAHNYNELHRSRDRWKKLACERESELNLLKAERDALRDELNWMHAELHGAEMGRTCRAISMRERDKRPYLYDELVCSECGCHLAHEFGHVWQRFCPNCGAKVVEE